MSVMTSEGPRSRAAIDDKFKWNLAELYPTAEAWRAEKARLAGEIARVRAFEGQLATSPATLADALELVSSLDKEVSRLYVYASMLGDEDTRESGPQGMQQEMQQLYADFGANASFIEPEILRVGQPTVEGFLVAEPRLGTYAFPLRDMFRRSMHTLSDQEEKLLADLSPLAGSASNIYGIFSNADFPYPSVTISTGRQVKVDHSGYSELRTSANRADRQLAMSTFFTSLGGFSRTFGTTMNAEVQKVLFYAKTRKYGSNLEMALNAANIPVTVYSRLIEGVNAHLNVFHRYLRLRQRMLKLTDGLRYYDLYAPLVASVNLSYTPEEAEAHILASFKPLGQEYVDVVGRSFAERWIDFYPSEGKRTGAYSNGAAYDVHPYMLLNYLGQYNDLSTLAHEIGHTMQSYCSNATQPYALANYPIFVAEVASTFNEALLIHYMLERITDTPTRVSLLGSYLENIKATVFRQTQFAEFELRMHEMAQRGEPITGDSLNELYLGITRRYYGHEAGVCTVDDYVAHEWSFIPHFYNDFYVYQYATSFTAAEALASKVLAGDADATSRYLAFLSAGGSKYPIDLLRDAGVDMTTDEPLTLTMAKMSAVMDEIEGVLDRGEV
ncbi:MAG: oligoendopeptidase F [Vicinamibacterales bacterium]